MKNKESVVLHSLSIVCATAMNFGAIILALIGEFECAMMSLILAQLILMEKNDRQRR